MKWDAKKYDSVKAPQVDAGRELIALANVRETDSILDLGCGTGKLTLELARLAMKGTVTGIDPSGEMLDEAGKRCHSFINVSLKQFPAQSIKFTGEFDLVFSNSAVHWIREQQLVAGLRPFLEQLPEKEREYFKYAFAMSFEKNRTEKGIEFNFRRLFAFAEK